MQYPFFRFFLSALISYLLIRFAFQGLQLHDFLSILGDARSEFIVLGFALLVGAYWIRGYRWIVWQQDLNVSDSIRLILIGAMGNNLLPARLGDVLRAYCTRRETSEEYGGTAALASIMIEHVLDGLFISIIGFLALIFSPLGPAFLYVLCGVFLVTTVLLVVFFLSIHFPDQFRTFLNRIHKTYPGHLTRMGKEKIYYLLDGILLLNSTQKFWKAFAISGGIWACEFVACFAVGWALFQGMDWGKSLLFLAVVHIAFWFPLTIGGIGAIEATAAAFLSSTGIPGDQALAMVVVHHGFQLGFTTLTGLTFYFYGEYFRYSERKGAPFPEAGPPGEKKWDILKENAQEKIDTLSLEFDVKEKRNKEKSISFVIPAFNEQNRLPKTLLKTVEWCTNQFPDFEIIIVDDGSSDETLNLAKLFSTQIRNIRYIACPHFGKGAAVKIGMLNARGDQVVFMDADGATPLNEFKRLFEEVNSGADIAIGSRVVQHAGDTVVETSAHRKIMGRIFAGIVNFFIISGVADTQCGFKLFRKAAADEIFGRQKLNGFAFDVEILWLARKMGFWVVEVPISWVDQKGSKVRLVRDSFRMLVDLFLIKWLHQSETLPSFHTQVEVTQEKFLKDIKR